MGTKTNSVLVRAREERGLTQAELVESVHVSAQTVGAWEAGEMPDSEHLLPLAAALGIGVEEILRGCGEAAEADAECAQTAEQDAAGIVAKQGADAPAAQAEKPASRARSIPQPQADRSQYRRILAEQEQIVPERHPYRGEYRGFGCAKRIALAIVFTLFLGGADRRVLCPRSRAGQGLERRHGRACGPGG